MTDNWEIQEIKDQIIKLKRLFGHDYCTSVKGLPEKATKEQYNEAWEKDRSVIKSMINDAELLI